ncbi:MAG: hotdog fold thioesterase [Deltaproteobacteria bacterium]|nr:hotdog fold thioesterase [Deltaproteobacteria bacterium]
MDEGNPISLLTQKASKEPFAKLLDLEVVDVEPGYAKVRMEVDEKKLNIHGITHGGALFGLIDEAFELASNSHGTVAVALNMNITFFAPTTTNDRQFGQVYIQVPGARLQEKGSLASTMTLSWYSES